MKQCILPLAAFAVAASTAAFAADYYVALTGDDTNNDGLSAEAPFATIDKAIITATYSDDVIHVAAGTYQTGNPDYVAQTDNAKWGPNLKAKIIGEGATRADVIIESHGEYRTLRMAAGSWVEKVTIVGEGTYKADKGGAIEMNGGTVTNCVIRDGTAYGNDSKNAGGNLYVNSDGALIVDCVISGGMSKNRGGNVCLDHGTLRNCTIMGGSIPEKKDDNAEQHGGNVWSYQGKIENCTISGGSAVLGGNVFLYNANAYVQGGLLSSGTASQSGGNIYLRQGTISGATLSSGATTSNNNSQGGGNVFAEGYEGGATSISACFIEDGTAKNRGGNAFLLAATITNSTISSGSIIDNASGIGGNVFMNNANALVSNCIITNGQVSARGGNIFMLAGTLQDSAVTGGICANPTDQYWGGANIFIQGGKISRCTVSGGTISGGQNRGGGISVQGDPSKTIEDTLVYGNANGGIYSASSKIDIWNCTIIDNAEFGFYRYGGTPSSLANCILLGNRRSSDDGLANFSGNLLTTALKLASDDSSRFESLGAQFVLIDDTAFADYANADYRPVANSALIDAGTIDNRSGASVLDLAGNPRQSGTIDIGCYEYQKPDMTVSIVSVDKSEALAPATFTFTHSANGAADPSTLRFTYDFGDGSANETTAAATISHEYANPGTFTVTITAESDCEDDRPATQSYDDYITVRAPGVYVNPGNASAAFPFDTPETGYATVAAALADALDGSTIRMVEGLYEQTEKLSVSKAVTIVGNEANPETVVLRNTATAQNGAGDKRVMAIDNAGAVVSGLTLEGGQVYHGNGGNLTISAGMISNCVIRSGIAYAGTDAEYGMGAGVALSGNGIVSHCVITNNEVQGAASGKWVQGGAVVFPWGSSGKLRNSLVAGNRWVIESDTAIGSAGILYHSSSGGARVDNCTVVANEIIGTCNEASSAAGVRCDWNSAIRNTVFAGNRIGTTVSNVYIIFAEEVWKDGLDTCVTEETLPSDNATCTTAPLARIFNNFTNGDYRPKSGGALYDKGREPYTAVSVDLAGKTRVFGKAIDIGCYECQSQPHTVIIML